MLFSQLGRIKRSVVMFGYVTVGVSDMERACDFYGTLLEEVGGKQLFGQDRIKFYGTALVRQC